MKVGTTETEGTMGRHGVFSTAKTDGHYITTSFRWGGPGGQAAGSS
jgi:hypothetical protein